MEKILFHMLILRKINQIQLQSYAKKSFATQFLNC
jgi:hypothetical protein